MASKKETKSIAGVDYGSRMAGTTVIAKWDGTMVQLFQSAKKKDADAFVLKTIERETITQIFLDAPLSLPGIYTGSSSTTDYFFRQSDKQLSAMSPMFLGGLTARAMQLKDQLKATGVEVIEIYPAHLAKLLGLKSLNYKKKKENLPEFLAALGKLTPFNIDELSIENWHQIDALLALFSGFRYLEGTHETFGEAAEGQIVV